MRSDGHVVTVDLAAQLCSMGIRLRRLQEVLPILPYLNLGPEELFVLMKICIAHQDDPTARFLEHFESSILYHERLTSRTPSKQFYEASSPAIPSVLESKETAWSPSAEFSPIAACSPSATG